MVALTVILSYWVRLEKLSVREWSKRCSLTQLPLKEAKQYCKFWSTLLVDWFALTKILESVWLELWRLSIGFWEKPLQELLSSIWLMLSVLSSFCAGLKTGYKAAFHSMSQTFECNTTQAILFVDASNIFNSLNHSTTLLNMEAIFLALGLTRIVYPPHSMSMIAIYHLKRGLLKRTP